MSAALRFIVIVACWCAVAGRWSLVDIALGSAIALVVQVLLHGAPRRQLAWIRPCLRFVFHVALDLVVSSCRIALDVLRPRPRWRPRVVEVQTDLRGAGMIASLGNAITLTPGSLTLEGDAESGRMLIHLCYGNEADDWARQVSATIGGDLARLGGDPSVQGRLEVLR